MRKHEAGIVWPGFERATSALPDVHLSECLSNFPDRIERLLAVPTPDGIGSVRPARRVLRRPNRKLSPPEIDQLVADYQAGLCLTGLGERFGLHRQTAKAHLERRGVIIRSELPALNEGQITQAVVLYTEGRGLNPIAALLGVAPNTVKRALLAQGVQLRLRGFAGGITRAIPMVVPAVAQTP